MRRVVPTPFPAEPAVPDAETFGALIRAARTHRGWSLDEAARRLGVSKQTMFDLERARVAVGLPLALRAAHELGIRLMSVPPSAAAPAVSPVAPPAGKADARADAPVSTAGARTARPTAAGGVAGGPAPRR